jgi:cystathionine beta-lyase
MAPSKTFNLPGLRCSVAIVPNRELREQFLLGASTHHPEVSVLGFVAAQAAYQHGQDWLDQVLHKLESNRHLVREFAQSHLPGVRVIPSEATYLAWLDCRQAGIPGNAFQFFLQEARVGLSDGADYGRGGEGFVRLNFATQRPVLEEALNRMRAALQVAQAPKAEV